MKERDELNENVYAINSLGREMIEEKLFDEDKEKEYEDRIANLEHAIKLLKITQIGEKNRFDVLPLLEPVYITYPIAEHVKHKWIKNPNWQGGKPVGYIASMAEKLNLN